MTTRFIKPKIDKYIQLYSKYAKNEGSTYIWELENPIDLDENGLIQGVDRAYANVPPIAVCDIYTIRMFDISSQSVVNVKNISDIPDQPSFNQGKIIDIGIPDRTIPNDIKLEIQPQIINRLVLRVNKGIFEDTAIDSAIEFFISLKITEKEPSIIQYGSLNNIIINQ